MADHFQCHGSLAADARQQAIGWVGQEIQRQAGFLAYVDAFWVLM